MPKLDDNINCEGCKTSDPQSPRAGWQPLFPTALKVYRGSQHVRPSTFTRCHLSHVTQILLTTLVAKCELSGIPVNPRRPFLTAPRSVSAAPPFSWLYTSSQATIWHVTAFCHYLIKISGEQKNESMRNANKHRLQTHSPWDTDVSY